MNRNQASAMAIASLREHGLWEKGWRFKFNSAKKINGICYFARKEIKLSSHYVDHNDADRIRNTILHEIAHALAGHKAAHGPAWQKICLSIGGDGQRCGVSNVSDAIRAAWQGTCRNGHSVSQHRAPLRVKACGRCANTFRPENVIVWEQHGRTVPVGSMPVRYVTEVMRMRSAYGDRLPI